MNLLRTLPAIPLINPNVESKFGISYVEKRQESCVLLSNEAVSERCTRIMA